MNGSRDHLAGRPLAEIEREAILATLAHCAGNRTHAARMLGISLRTIRNKLRKYRRQGEIAEPRLAEQTRPGCPPVACPATGPRRREDGSAARDPVMTLEIRTR